VKILGESVPGARTELVAGAAHLPNMEEPERVNRLLGDFLAQSPRP
jgi:pimeloyl-ACP methyl ester carboxylesterase